MLDRDDGLYRNSAAADLYLDRAKPGYIGGILEMANARLYRFWGALTEALRTGEPQNESKGSGRICLARSMPILIGSEGFLSAMSGISARPTGDCREIPVDRLRELRRCRLCPGHGSRDARAQPSSPLGLWLRSS